MSSIGDWRQCFREVHTPLLRSQQHFCNNSPHVNNPVRSAGCMSSSKTEKKIILFLRYIKYIYSSLIFST